MVYHLRRTLIAVVFFVLSYVALSALHSHLDPNTSKSEEEREDNVWIATSKYWVDRQACRYLGLCGLAHYRPDPAMKPWKSFCSRLNPVRSYQPPISSPGAGSPATWRKTLSKLSSSRCRKRE